ncbi:MAG TPA: type II secretion system F family protein [Candidatus Saccharimonadales bacterium]|nr:type II secretion system F family protein [Candidatus Saccharimonadales bacterium]
MPAAPAPEGAHAADPKAKAKKKFRLPFREQEYFTDNLSMLLKSAVPVGDALRSLGETTHNKRLKQALVQMNTDVESGRSLADALETSHLVSSQTLALVRLGEASGHLVENLQLAAQQEEKRHVFRSKVRSALIYPSFVMSLTGLVGLGVAWFLLPRLATTFKELHVHLPFISRVLIDLGNFLKLHGLVAVPAFLLVCGLAGYGLFGLPQAQAVGQRFLLFIPGIGRLMREVEIAQFGYLLGTLLDAGLPVTQAVKLLAGATHLVEYRDFYSYLADSLDDGYSFKESLSRYKYSSALLAPSVQQMVVAGERSGALPEVLLTIGRTYEQKSDTTTANLEAIIEPILLIVVWFGVMLVAVAVIVPIYSLVGGLGK